MGEIIGFFFFFFFAELVYSRVLFAPYCVKYYLPSDRRGRDGHLLVASPSLVYRVFLFPIWGLFTCKDNSFMDNL